MMIIYESDRFIKFVVGLKQYVRYFDYMRNKKTTEGKIIARALALKNHSYS